MKHLRWFPIVAAVVLASVLGSAQQTGGAGTGSAPSAPKSDASDSQPVRIPQGVTQGLLIKKVVPKYPKKARKARIQGQVVLQADINKNGDIENLSLISGDPMLAASSIDAVKQWRYKPYLLYGQPVAVRTQIVVNFALAER